MKQNMRDENSNSPNSVAILSREGRKQRGRLLRYGVPALALLISFIIGAAWIGIKAAEVKRELEASINLVPQLKHHIEGSDSHSASITVSELRKHTFSARQAVDDPVWILASGLPWAGPNLRAVSEVARSADDVARLGLSPLVGIYDSLDWNALLPSSSGTNLEPIKAAAPTVASSAYAVKTSSDRLARIDASQLLPQVAAPLLQARKELEAAVGALDTAADATSIAPAMLGGNGVKTYLVMIQNNAEARASGGIPGALAVLTLDRGNLILGRQSSAGDIGIISPVLPVDPSQQQIYSTRLGKYMQDVNLTPDFPTAASTAQAMWEKKTGQRVDGVISIDPVVLSFILEVTGPVAVNDAEIGAVKAAGLPTELTGSNVVSTLLSDVYAKIQEPKLQDAYFAGVAKEVFAALADGRGEAKALIGSLARGTDEGRVLVWSAQTSEQTVLSKYSLSGSIAGPSVSPAQFGVYFNDGTGAKMDYHVKRTVQLIKECPRDGYEQTTVRIASTNTAPSDAATSLPDYVTGGGAFGVPAGSVQTNIVAYGPVQANVESAKVDGQNTNFSSFEHSSRPVGTLALRLAPGESSTVDFTFAKIVQHAEPSVVVTPTVQDFKEVIQTTQVASCG